MELVVHLLGLGLIHPFQFRSRCLESLVGAASQNFDLFQIPAHLLDGMVRRLDLCLALGFQEQLRLLENALPDLGRRLVPGGV